MARSPGPDLAQYLNKRVSIQLGGARKVVGMLKGYDLFLNIVLEDAFDETSNTPTKLGTTVIRGVSVLSLEVM